MTGRNEKLPCPLSCSVCLFTRLIPPLSLSAAFSCVVRGKKGSFSLSLAPSPHPSSAEHFAEVVLRDQRLNPIALAIVIARRAEERD